MDLPERTLEAVTERDIDLLLFEEVRANCLFAQWFVKKILPEMEPASISVWHSLTDAELGESDLVLLVNTGRATHAILVENKVDAPRRPRRQSATGPEEMLESSMGNG